MKRLFPWFLIFAVSFVAAHKMLSFYFWHDDFSVLYSARVECIYSWPYEVFCSLFPFLESVFKYNPYLYFGFGFILFVLCGFLLYKYMLELFAKPVATILALLFSSGYVGAGVFLEAWDPITTFLSLGAYLPSLTLLTMSIKDGIKLKHFMLSLFVFSVSLVVFRVRSSTYLFPSLITILFFSKEANLKKILLSIIYAICFIAVYLFPYQFPEAGIGSIVLTYFSNNPSKILVDFTHTLSSFVFGSVPLGVLLSVMFMISLLKIHNNKRLFALCILGISWVVFLYLPFAIKLGSEIDTTHRYIVFIYPGILIAWGTFAKKTGNVVWISLGVLIILANLILVNRYLGSHQEKNLVMRNFYAQLHQEVGQLKPGSIIYFDFPSSFRNQGTDFFRVGYSPSESAIGTEFGIKYADISLITESDVLRRRLTDGSIDPLSFYSYYFDGENLVDTTPTSRKLIKPDSQTNVSIDKLIATVPVKVSLTASASLKSYPLLPCQDCAPAVTNLTEHLRLLSRMALLRNQTDVDVNSAGDDTVAFSLIDDNLATYWIGKRQEWVEKTLPSIDLRVKRPELISGVVMYSDFVNHIPKQFEIKIDGKEIEHDVAFGDRYVKLEFDPKRISAITIKVIATDGGDVPAIRELELTPSGYTDINYGILQELKLAPSKGIKSREEYDALRDLLVNGTTACLIWSSDGHGSGATPFTIYVDGRTRNYDVWIPSTGVGSPILKMECVDPSVDISVGAMTFNN